MKHVIFIYGTLRKGLRLHHHMQGADYLERARLKGRLYDVGTYPGLVVDPNSDWVWGELFQLSEELIKHLDSIEEYDPNNPSQCEYIRKRVSVLNSHDQMINALTYVYNFEPKGLTLIRSGDYKKYLEFG